MYLLKTGKSCLLLVLLVLQMCARSFAQCPATVTNWVSTSSGTWSDPSIWQKQSWIGGTFPSSTNLNESFKIQGDVVLANSGSMLTLGQPAIICGTLVVDGDLKNTGGCSPLEVYGKLIVKGDLKSAQSIRIRPGGELVVYGSWIIEGGANADIQGNMAVKGNVDNTMGLNLTTSGNLLVFGSYKEGTCSNAINGNVVIGGSITIDKWNSAGGTGKIYALSGGDFGQTPTLGKADLDANTALKDLYTEYQGKFELSTVTVSLSANPNTPICEGAAVTIAAVSSTANLFTFYKNGSTVPVQAGIQSTYTYIPQNGDVVAVVAADGTSSATASLAPLVVKSKPQLEGYSFTPIPACSGGDATVVMSGSQVDVSYQLYDGASTVGLSSVGTGSSISFSIPSQPTTTSYSIVATNTLTGCQSSITNAFTMPLASPPNAQIAASKTTVCSGDAVVVTATDGGSNTGTYRFFRNGKEDLRAVGNVLIISNLTSDDEVYATITNANGCTSSTPTIKFTVNPLPSAALHVSAPEGKSCQGEELVLTSSLGLASYSFVVNGVVAAPQASNVYKTKLTTSGVNTFSVVATNSLGCSYQTPEVKVDVLTLPSADPFEKDIAANEICFGTPVKFTAPSGGNTYSFIVNGASRGSQSVSEISISDLPVGVGVEVKVRVSSNNGCYTESAPITMNVNPLPKVDIAPAEPSPTCEGSLLTFSALPASGLTYAFSIDGISVSSVGNQLNTSSLVNGSIVEVKATDSKGCSAVSATKPIVVKPTPLAQIVSSDADNVACSGSNITLTAPAGYSSYKFTVDGAVIDMGTTNSLTINNVTASKTLLLNVLHNGCSSTSPITSIQVQLPPPAPSSIAGPDMVFGIPGHSAYTSSGMSGYNSYKWEITPNTFGEFTGQGASSINVSWNEMGGYTVKVYGYNQGCGQSTGSKSIDVVAITGSGVGDTPTLDKSFVCLGDQLTFTSGDILGLGTKTYEWQITNPDKTISVLATGSNINKLNWTPPVAGDYRIRVRYTFRLFISFVSSWSSSVPFTVHSKPQDLDLSSDKGWTICEGASVKLTATANDVVDSYSFAVNGSWNPSTPSNSYSTGMLKNGNTLNVRATNLCGASELPSPKVITTKTIEPVAISATPNPICNGGTTQLSALPTGATRYDFFADGNLLTSTSSSSYTTASGVIHQNSKVKVAMHDVCGVSMSPELVMGILPLPQDVVLSVAPSSTLCAGTSAIFEATSGYSSYQFFVNGLSVGAPSSSNQFTWPTPKTGDVVTVVATDPCGFSASSKTSVVLTVRPVPKKELSIVPSTLTICEGDALNVAAEAGWLGYEFKVNGATTATLTANTYTFAGLKNGDVISVDIRYSCGSTTEILTSNQYTVGVLAKPRAKLTTSIVGSEVCAGTSVTATASGGAAYQHTINGLAIVGATSEVYIHNNLHDGDIIGVAVSNGICTDRIDLPPLKVHQLPVPTLTTSPKPTCAGANITLSLTKNYKDYTWEVAPSPPLAISGSALQTITVAVPSNDILFPVGSKDIMLKATIKVSVEDEFGCKTLQPSIVEVPIYRIPRTGAAYHISNTLAK